MRKGLPAWAMGMANTPVGFYYGFITTAMPFVLASRGHTTGEIATVSAIGFSPTFWAFLLSPILDVRFTKKQYAVGLFVFAAICLGLAVLTIGHLGLFTAVLTLGCVAASLGASALAALLVDAVDDSQFGHVSAWYNVANLGAAGVFGSISILLIGHTPVLVAAVAIALLMMAPLILFAYFPEMAAVRDVAVRRGGNAFLRLFKDLYTLLKRRECVLGLIAFVAPGSAFALTNLFSGLGDAYHAQPTTVTWVSGVGVAIACSLGCLLGGPVADRFSRLHIYVATGIVGAVVAGAMMRAPRTTAVFVVGMLAYNLAQGLNYTAFLALAFELTGKKNPLAGTQMALLAAASNLPISYMTKFDGMASDRWGLTGMYAVDCLAGLIASVGLLLMFRWAMRERVIPDGV